MAIGVTLQQDAASGLGHVNSIIGAANAGVGAASGAASAMRSDTAAMRDQARLVNTQALNVDAEADALKALVPQLEPYKATLTDYGDELAQLERSLTARANDVYGQGGALMGMDPTKGGLSAEYIRLFNNLSPDRYVSRAASDVQGAFANAAGQLDRDNARRGISPGSGASMALRRQYAQALAVAKAAAKTNARQQGLSEQAQMLAQMTDAAGTLYSMGNQTQSQALAALGGAGDMQKGAAGIVTAQGEMVNSAAALKATVADLYAKGASVFGMAAGLEGDAGSLVLNSYKTLADAQKAAADYYTSVMSIASGRGGGGGMVVGSTISPSTGDNWMNWNGTGHSETWNHNHPTESAALLAAAQG